MSFCRVPVFAAIFASVGVSAAFGDPVSEPGAVRPWSLRVGGESGGDSSRGSTASLDYSGIALGTGVSVLHSDAPDKSGATITNGGRGYVKYGSNAFKGGVAFDVSSDEDFRHSQRWTGSLDFDLKGWNAGLSLATRKTIFESFQTGVSGRPRLGGSAEVSANADCSLRDLGYGASVGYNTDRWSVSASGSWNNYDTVSCGYDVSALSSLSRLNRSQFQQLAGGFLDRAVARAGGRIGQDTRLLSSQQGAGVAHHWERFSLSFDYTRSQDEFGGATQDGYALTGTMLFNSTIALDVVVGATSGDSTTDPTDNSSATPYAGAYVTVSF
jgi:hypothetical protein